jgi:RimJ/RimL family protein N-acetyltransferase
VTWDLEPEVFDAARIRVDERVFAAMGRVKYTTVALAPAGDVVAYSEVAMPRHEPGRMFQWGTLVRPEHRGRRLGLATKAHNLRFLRQHEPDRSVVYTYNADVNDHMIRVNEALGFRPVGRLGEFQKEL